VYQQQVSDNWFFKQRDPEQSLLADFASEQGWHGATVPGVVQVDLLATGRIPDPHYGLNEQEVAWVGDEEWLYRTTFDCPQAAGSANFIDLCFDGLDTVATVWLNGVEILNSDTMFVPHRVPVKHLLRPDGNEVWLHFAPSLAVSRAREQQYGRRNVANGDSSRIYLRKAQYAYGWDWGPTLLTAGPWLPVRLEAYDARIQDVACEPDISDDHASATLHVRVQIDTPTMGVSQAEVVLRDPQEQLIATAVVPVTGASLSQTFSIRNPALWWPRGYGEQPLYRVDVRLLDENKQDVDSITRRIGLRQVRLVQEPLAGEEGTTFYFAVNDVPLFCGGANWIPGDTLLPRMAAGEYRRLVEAAAEANMVMLRVWGGGIYEHEAFYDACDELGVLVWQDFMFACGVYPAYEAFVASVHTEAEAQVRRLRHHPSIVLWCGNNEDYQMGPYDANITDHFETTGLPARTLYEQVLPQVCERLDPTRPYWPGSPFGGSQPNDSHIGDRHTWEIWHSPVAPYSEFARYEGRFISEFGMMSYPDRATIDAFAPPEERYPHSRTLEFHNRSDDGPRRLALYLTDTLRVPADLDAHIYATQFVQAEALGTALRSWRRQWRGAGAFRVGGALIWQLNDCWPAISWSLLDSVERRKPAYYVVKRELAPLALGIEQGATANNIRVWGMNGTLQTTGGVLLLSRWSLQGELLARVEQQVTLSANGCSEFEILLVDQAKTGTPTVMQARLMEGGNVLARAALWPTPFKYLHMPDPGVAYEYLEMGDVQVATQRPAKGVWLSTRDDVVWSDNMLDLFPDDPQIIHATGVDDQQIRMRWLD
jgi:beta-mannosidase